MSVSCVIASLRAFMRGDDLLASQADSDLKLVGIDTGEWLGLDDAFPLEGDYRLVIGDVIRGVDIPCRSLSVLEETELIDKQESLQRTGRWSAALQAARALYRFRPLVFCDLCLKLRLFSELIDFVRANASPSRADGIEVVRRVAFAQRRLGVRSEAQMGFDQELTFNFDLAVEDFARDLWAQGRIEEVVQLAFSYRTAARVVAPLVGQNAEIQAALIHAVDRRDFDASDMANLVEVLWKKGSVETALLIVQGRAMLNEAAAEMLIFIGFNGAGSELMKPVKDVTAAMAGCFMDSATAQGFVRELGLGSFLQAVFLSREGAALSKGGMEACKVVHGCLPAQARRNTIFNIIAMCSVMLYINGGGKLGGKLQLASLPHTPIDTSARLWRVRLMFEALLVALRTESRVQSDCRLFGHAIGDETVLFAWHRALFHPHIIIGASVWRLRPGHERGEKRSLLACLRQAPDGDRALLLMLGAADCEWNIPKHVSAGRVSSVHEAIRERMAIYKAIIGEIRQHRQGLKRIVVHPVILRDRSIAPIVCAFNRGLREMCKAAGVEFLDVGTGGQGPSVARQDCGEYRFALGKALEALDRGGTGSKGRHR